MKYILVFLLGISMKTYSQEKPNVLLIIVDDLRYDFLDEYSIHFPSIDSLRASSLEFQNCFVNYSLCIPSRASILSGKYAHKHKTYKGGDNLKDFEFVDLMVENGYESSTIGKWHSGSQKYSDQPFKNRYNLVLGDEDQLYFNPTFKENHERSIFSGHITDAITLKALSTIENAGASPFFIALNYFSVHAPFQPKSKWMGYFDTVNVEIPNFDDSLEGKPSFLSSFKTSESKSNMLSNKRRSLETLKGVDESISRIISILNELGILDKTLIVFTSDNGLFFGDHGFMTHKELAYEESIRVPLFFRYPKLFKPLTRNNEVVSCIDIPKTILDITNSNFGSVDGRSLLDNSEVGVHKYAYYQKFRNSTHPTRGWIPEIRSIRDSRYKYITYPDTLSVAELYDLQIDPEELVNLSSNSDFSSLLIKLQCDLDSVMLRLGDSLKINHTPILAEELLIPELLEKDSVFIIEGFSRKFLDLDDDRLDFIFSYDKTAIEIALADENLIIIPKGDGVYSLGIDVRDNNFGQLKMTFPVAISCRQATKQNKFSECHYDYGLNLFPNPTYDVLNYFSLKGIKDIKIVNLGGQLLRTFDLNGKNEGSISLKGLEKGLYLVISQFQGDQIRVTKKIYIQ